MVWFLLFACGCLWVPRASSQGAPSPAFRFSPLHGRFSTLFHSFSLLPVFFTDWFLCCYPARFTFVMPFMCAIKLYLSCIYHTDRYIFMYIRNITSTFRPGSFDSFLYMLLPISLKFDLNFPPNSDCFSQHFEHLNSVIRRGPGGWRRSPTKTRTFTP